jgi:hypothetical protein
MPSESEALIALRADLQKGVDDFATGRFGPFDPEEIIAEGMRKSARC